MESELERRTTTFSLIKLGPDAEVGKRMCEWDVLVEIEFGGGSDRDPILGHLRFFDGSMDRARCLTTICF
jgi:hypothetical protein